MASVELRSGQWLQMAAAGRAGDVLGFHGRWLLLQACFRCVCLEI
jgi:hypothetical protein